MVFALLFFLILLSDDAIMARTRTTGIIHEEFPDGPLMFEVVDVGGQRSERKKWINCFADVKAVLFVVNLSGYDNVLFEDETKNRMMEEMDLFKSVAQYNIFAKTPFYIIYTKKVSGCVCYDWLRHEEACCYGSTSC